MEPPAPAPHGRAGGRAGGLAGCGPCLVVVLLLLRPSGRPSAPRMMLSVCSLHGFSFGGVYLVLIFFWTQGYMIVIAQRNSTVLVAPNNIRPYVWLPGSSSNNNRNNKKTRRISCVGFTKIHFFLKGNIFTEYSEKYSQLCQRPLCSVDAGTFLSCCPARRRARGSVFFAKKGSGSGSRSTISLRPRTYGAAPSSLRWPGAQGGVVVEAKSKDRSSTPCG